MVRDAESECEAVKANCLRSTLVRVPDSVLRLKRDPVKSLDLLDKYGLVAGDYIALTASADLVQGTSGLKRRCAMRLEHCWTLIVSVKS